MISTIVRISWMNLERDRVALLLTFLLPLVFFSIFAGVFGGMDHDRMQPIKTLLAIEDDHMISERLAELLRQQTAIELLESDRHQSKQSAVAQVRAGTAAVAVVIPPGFGSRLATPGEARPEIEILTDGSNPVAAGVISGIVQASVLRLGAETIVSSGRSETPAPELDAEDPQVGPEDEPLTLSVVDVIGNENKQPSVAYFAAGIGVMFLLFALTGRSAILIEERESGVLSRLLAARVSLGDLLVGRWLFLTALGCLQMTVMFVWASLAFGLDLWTVKHASGFVVMTAASASVAAAFGIALSSACRSRAQLTGVSAVVILILSALGGSMFPRFLMPEKLAAIGQLTFNSWAVDGYQRIFWYEAGVTELWPQLLVLLTFSLLFLSIARLLARRWQEA